MRHEHIYIVHGWDGGPDKDWIPWLVKELEARGYFAKAITMPNPATPEIVSWVSTLKSEIGDLDHQSILIGHSIGCQAILRYLASLPTDHVANKVIMVAPWVTLTDDAMPTPEDVAIAKPWIKMPIDFDKIKRHANEFIAIFSPDDPWVPYQENRKVFEENLGAKIIVEEGKGHFTTDEGVAELPIILELLSSS